MSGLVIVPSICMDTKWSPEKVKILRKARANGLTHAEVAPLVGFSPNAVAQKVRRLGIQAEPCKRPSSPPLAPVEPPHEPSIPYTVSYQAVTDYHGGWDNRELCYHNNHLYREAISLAAVW